MEVREKWAVGFECDLDKGVCTLARKMKHLSDGFEYYGDVALFDTLEQAKEWVEKSGEIDSSLFDISYIKTCVEK